jgi:hypothetical protein
MTEDLAKMVATEFFESIKKANSQFEGSDYYMAINRNETVQASMSKREEIKQVVTNAVKAFMRTEKPDESLSFKELYVVVNLQGVNSDTYKPIASPIHADSDIDKGSRYGRPAAEQDVSSLITSFCAYRLGNEGDAKLSACGTVYYDGVPILDTSLVNDVVNKARESDPLVTDYEIIGPTVGYVLEKATSQELNEFNDKQLKELGITIREAPMLKWTNVNSLVFHRSPRMDDVMGGASERAAGGLDAQRMRMFAVVTSTPDEYFELLGTEIDINESYTYKGNTFPVYARVMVMDGQTHSMMAEDVGDD